MKMTYLFVVIVFIALVMAAALVMMWYFNKREKSPKTNNLEVNAESEKAVSTKRQKSTNKEEYKHISELINIELIEPGIYYAKGKYLGLARIEGTNFSILSDGEQDIREDILIAIQNQIKYPVQYITSTIVADTDRAVEKVREYAEKASNNEVAEYARLYAAELENMKDERRAMTKVSWIVISGEADRPGAPGNPVQRIRERMAILQEAFRSRAGIIMTPLTTTEEVIDTFQQIMLPEKLVKPSEVAKLCLQPIKFNIKELISTGTN